MEKIKTDKTWLRDWFRRKYNSLVEKNVIDGEVNATSEEKKKHFDELMSDEYQKEKLLNRFDEDIKNDLMIMARTENVPKITPITM